MSHKISVCFPPDGSTPYVLVGGKHIGKVRRMDLVCPSSQFEMIAIEVYPERRMAGAGEVEADIPSYLKHMIKLVKD